MDLNQRHFKDYYRIQPKEIARDVFIIFNDNRQHSHAKCTFQTPFAVELGANGRRNVGLACTHFTAVNSVANLVAEHASNLLGLGTDDDDVTWLNLRTGYYESQDVIFSEIQKQLLNAKREDDSISNYTINFDRDHLGILKHSGNTHVYIPYSTNDSKIPDPLSGKLGFTQELELLEHNDDGLRYTKIPQNTQAAGYGDLFCATADIMLSCDQCMHTPETERVISTFNVASQMSRAYAHWKPLPRFRPLHDLPEVTHLDLRLMDRFHRSMTFVSGTPSAIIELMHLS